MTLSLNDLIDSLYRMALTPGEDDGVSAQISLASDVSDYALGLLNDDFDEPPIDPGSHVARLLAILAMMGAEEHEWGEARFASVARVILANQDNPAVQPYSSNEGDFPQ